MTFISLADSWSLCISYARLIPRDTSWWNFEAKLIRVVILVVNTAVAAYDHTDEHANQESNKDDDQDGGFGAHLKHEKFFLVILKYTLIFHHIEKWLWISSFG